MSPTPSRNARHTADESLITGVLKFFSSYAALTIGSTTMKPADIVKLLQDRIDTSKAVLAADAARTAAIKADRDKRAQTAGFVQSLRRTVVGMFTESPDTLATFGLHAPKAAKTTVATKAEAVAKNKATREARGTLGSKQKKNVKGTVPAAAPAATSKASQPAAASTAPSTTVSAPSQGSTGGTTPPHAT
jgi:hypothetical protein